MRVSKSLRGAAAASLAIVGALVLANPAPARADSSDTTPAGMVAYFAGQTACPTGWTEASYLQGRLALAVTDTANRPIGTDGQVGDAMTDQTPPTHTHDYKGAATLAAKDLPGTPCKCCNHGGAAAGSYAVHGPMDANDGQPPFFQILACERDSHTQSVADGYQLGTLAFFNSTSCPTNWIEAVDNTNAKINGYFLMPFYRPEEGQTGAVYGGAYGNLDQWEHHHDISTTISLTRIQYEKQLLATHCDSLTADGSHPVSGDTYYAWAGVPYTQLLLCERGPNGNAVNPPSGVPTDVVMSFSTYDCPSGWKASSTGTGRFFVGLPDGGAPDQAFGSDPLAAPGDTTSHTHGFKGSVDISEKEVEAASGTDSDDYGRHDTVSFSGTSSAHEFELPYMVTASCQPCVTDDSDPDCQ